MQTRKQVFSRGLGFNAGPDGAVIGVSAPKFVGPDQDPGVTGRVQLGHIVFGTDADIHMAGSGVPTLENRQKKCGGLEPVCKGQPVRRIEKLKGRL